MFPPTQRLAYPTREGSLVDRGTAAAPSRPRESATQSLQGTAAAQSLPIRRLRKAPRYLCILVATLVSSTTLTGCLVMGYSSGSGWWVWPGSLALTLVILLLLFLINRR